MTLKPDDHGERTVRTHAKRLRDCEGGFTLSELLVVIVVLAFIGMAFAAIFSSVVNHSATISSNTFFFAPLSSLGSVTYLLHNWPLKFLKYAE